MKKLFLISFVCLFASALDMHAQNTIKFGTVDAMAIIYLMPEYAAVQKKLEAKSQEFQAELESMSNAFVEKAGAYDKKKATLSQKEQEEMEQQLQQEYNRYQQRSTQTQQEMQQMQEAEITPIHTKLKNAIAAVGQKNGFIQIFDEGSSNALYNNPAYVIDVTDLVKKELGIK